MVEWAGGEERDRNVTVRIYCESSEEMGVERQGNGGGATEGMWVEQEKECGNGLMKAMERESMRRGREKEEVGRVSSRSMFEARCYMFIFITF